MYEYLTKCFRENQEIGHCCVNFLDIESFALNIVYLTANYKCVMNMATYCKLRRCKHRHVTVLV